MEHTSATTDITHELHGECGDDDRVSVQSLLDDDGEFGVWWRHGPGQHTYRLSAEEAPDAGGSVHTPVDVVWTADDDVTLVEIPLTTWGDYAGDIVNRANHRAILESHADDVVEVTWSMSGYSLALRLDGTISGVLADEIRGLSEYPLICEETLGELEMELEGEDWENYGECDLKFDIERKLENLRDGDNVELAWLLTDKLCEAPSSAALLRIAGRAYASGGLTWEVESAVGGYFRGLEELADVIVAARVSRAYRDLAVILREYGQTPGQLQLS